MIVLVTGGARSGKSGYAEGIMGSLRGEKLYIATAIPFDEEMKDRIKKHQSVRPVDWTTYEGFKQLELVLKEGHHYDGILLDCVTLWLTNLLFHYAGDREIEDLNQKEINLLEGQIKEELERFIEEAEKMDGTVILVTNEIGMSIVPENKLSRIFRDIQGRMNQLLGKAADEVYLVVCGIPLKIKA